MTHKKSVRPLRPPPSEDRSWAARVEGLNRDVPAGVAMAAAIFSTLAMLIGWSAILIPPGGNIRFNPLYWVLMAPLILWVGGLRKASRWAIHAVWPALVLAPCLSLLALFVAHVQRDAALLGDGVQHLDTPLAMLIILGVTTALAVAGAVALLRSSLPGGTRPITYIAPGTPRPGFYPLQPAATLALMKGSLPFSGALINGMFFAIVAMLEPIGPYGEMWPVVVVAALVLSVGTLVFRGGFRLKRHRVGAARDLSRGWSLGMGCATVAVPALWALPVPIAGKLGFSCFMVPLAAAAIWFGTRALKALPDIIADRERNHGVAA